MSFIQVRGATEPALNYNSVLDVTNMFNKVLHKC